MATQVIEKERIRQLNDEPEKDRDYVLYWMQQSQRAEFNPALEHAVREANRLGRKLLVVFGLTDDYPDANSRHYRFLLEGLQDAQRGLERRRIRFVCARGHPADVAILYGKRASLIITDRGYLRHQKQWRAKIAQEADCRVVEVEGDVLVPVGVASNKAEYAARTIRPKLEKHWARFLVELKPTPLKKSSLSLAAEGIDLGDPGTALQSLDVDTSVKPVEELQGGTTEGKRKLRRFLEDEIDRYNQDRNRPEIERVSHISPYLHFGQISPVQVALEVADSRGAQSVNRESYLEELLIRRELAINFVNYSSDYDSFSCLPDWARKTLHKHASDRREHVYTRNQLEDAETHDKYWNAAMTAMKLTGYLHNYLRMYWGKKILQWTNTPEHAYRVTLELNNKYFLDGRDANSYANVGWIFGLHDRPWPERPVFGTVRYMSAGGLERKCDAAAYVAKIEALADRVSESRSSQG